MSSAIKAIDTGSIHRITSGQVIIDLQTAVKELLENSFDAGATSVEVRFKEYGVKSIEVVDNGSGIAEADHDSIALKHHTSKLASFEDLSTVLTYGFRGEALSSLCALCESVTVMTCTGGKSQACKLDLNKDGSVKAKTLVARPRGTTVTLTNLFYPLPVRRRELERNGKREFAKALNLLHAYALVPCAKGVRLGAWNWLGTKKTSLLMTPTPTAATLEANVRALYGPKSTDSLVSLDFSFEFEPEKSVLKRLGLAEGASTRISIHGLISKFSPGCGRTASDRQFFYVNGRPWGSSKVAKTFNELYHSFNANQSPVVVVDFQIPTDAVDINVTPDKRTIFVHSEGSFLQGVKDALEEHFSSQRAIFQMGSTQRLDQPTQRGAASQKKKIVQEDKDESSEEDEDDSAKTSDWHAQRHGRPADDETFDIEIGGSAPPTAPTLSPRMSTPAPASWTPGSEPSTIERPVVLPSSGGTNSDRMASMILDTSGSSWDLPHDDEGISEGPPRKKRKSEIGNDADDGEAQVSLATTSREKSVRINLARREERPNPTRLGQDGKLNSRRSLRNNLLEYARSGSRVADMDVDEVEDAADVAQDEGDTEPEALERGEGARRRPEADNDLTLDTSSELGHANAAVGGMEVVDLTSDMDDPESSSALAISSLTSIALDSSDAVSHLQTSMPRPEVLRTLSGGDVSLRFDVTKLAGKWQLFRQVAAQQQGQSVSRATIAVDADAGVGNVSDQDRAADALSRVIDKQDFESMDVIGQFNKGFIIVRRRKAVANGLSGGEGQNEVEEQITDDLFIVDQHAADEKYNFETLQLTTKIDSQKLFQAQPLELTAAQELAAIDNIDILRQNGFEVTVDEDLQPTHGCRLKLVAQPVSKSTTFDMKDLDELIHLMEDRPPGQMVRCTKARSMFAMRACRKSVMVGMPLTKRQMKTVVAHMALLDQPWNCPHGRPTMRHLSDVPTTPIGLARSVDWNALCLVN